MTKLLENNREVECCDPLPQMGVPQPVWPEDETQTYRQHTKCPVAEMLRNKSQHNEDKDSKSKIDRCFGIRHQPIYPTKEECDDSIVTEPVISMTGFTSSDKIPDSYEKVEEDIANKSREDMDKVIQELTAAVKQSKGVSTLTNAMEKSKVYGSHVESMNIAEKRKRRRSVEERNARLSRKDNIAFDSDDSELSVPQRTKTKAQKNLANPIAFKCNPSQVKNIPKQESERHGYIANTLSHSSALSSSSWFLSQKDPRPLRTDLDFKNYQYNYNLFLAEEFARAARMHSERIVSSQASKRMLAMDFDTWIDESRKEKRSWREFLRVLCFLLLLCSFVLVIIAVSILLTKMER